LHLIVFTMKNKIMSSKKLISYLILGLCLFSCKKDEIEIIGEKEEFTMTSSIINDDYPLFVYFPSNYDPSAPNQLIIGLDGEFRFEEVADVISEKSENGSIPPCIFVAIGNSDERNRDYTPTKFQHGEGGAENYYDFLKNELIPELESRYNIDTSNTKTLIGNSFGGLFTHYTMFQDRVDNPFNKFVSTGCSFWFDSGVIFEYEENYNVNNTDLDVTFFSGMGSLEGGVNLASVEEMEVRLKSRSYSNLNISTVIINKHGHSGAATIGFKKGLDYVFSN
jgi:predicted alpha/beta superfamily hydrolase